jgi:hypothetical protein
VAVSEHPPQKLKRQKDSEKQIHHPQPSRIGDKGGGNKVGDRGEVDGQKASLEGDCRRAVAVEQVPQLYAEPP